MPETIISDTSCFIILTNIDALYLLNAVYGQVVTTPEIANEYGEAFPEWVKITSVRDKYKQQLIEMQIDKGEASAIALALEMPQAPLLLMIIRQGNWQNGLN